MPRRRAADRPHGDAPQPGRPRRRLRPAAASWLETFVGRRPANDDAGAEPDAGLGAAIIAARRRGVRWKELTQRYGFSRTRLWELCREAEAQEAAAAATRRAESDRSAVPQCRLS